MSIRLFETRIILTTMPVVLISMFGELRPTNKIETEDNEKLILNKSCSGRVPNYHLPIPSQLYLGSVREFSSFILLYHSSFRCSLSSCPYPLFDAVHPIFLWSSSTNSLSLLYCPSTSILKIFLTILRNTCVNSNCAFYTC